MRPRSSRADQRRAAQVEHRQRGDQRRVDQRPADDHVDLEQPVAEHGDADRDRDQRRGRRTTRPARPRSIPASRRGRPPTARRTPATRNTTRRTAPPAAASHLICRRSIRSARRYRTTRLATAATDESGISRTTDCSGLSTPSSAWTPNGLSWSGNPVTVIGPGTSQSSTLIADGERADVRHPSPAPARQVPVRVDQQQEHAGDRDGGRPRPQADRGRRRAAGDLPRMHLERPVAVADRVDHQGPGEAGGDQQPADRVAGPAADDHSSGQRVEQEDDQDQQPGQEACGAAAAEALGVRDMAGRPHQDDAGGEQERDGGKGRPRKPPQRSVAHAASVPRRPSGDRYEAAVRCRRAAP